VAEFKVLSQRDQSPVAVWCPVGQLFCLSMTVIKHNFYCY